jgi:subtilisin family serine protease
MRQPVFTSAQLPAYHEGMVVVKMRPSAEALAMTATVRGAPEMLVGLPGLSALSVFDRAGMVKRVVPLARQPEQERVLMGTRSVVAALAATAGPPPTPDPNAGVSLVELERDSDVPQLQMALANDPHIEFVSRVPVRYLVAAARRRPQAARPATGIQATPPPTSTMWNLRKIRWAEARALGDFTEAGTIRAAVLDTGIDPDHPDLQGRVSSYAFAHPDLPDASSNRDIIGHGTHVAGTMGALINNALGINGICACQLAIWKIFDDVADYLPFRNEFAYFVDPVMYRRALADCLEQGIDVINLSIGGPGRPDPQEQHLFNVLLANGTTIVAAMGNERQIGSPTSYPAAIPGVIAVGATSLNDRVANFSNRGNHISLCAPGVAIWSTLPTYPGQFGFEAALGPGGLPIEGKPLRRDTDYDAWDGTSMASPHVAAAAALLVANRDKRNAAAVRAQLMKTADQVAGMNNRDFHPDYGAGRLNLLRLLSESEAVG